MFSNTGKISEANRKQECLSPRDARFPFSPQMEVLNLTFCKAWTLFLLFLVCLALVSFHVLETESPLVAQAG